jgi:hypothetical protein
MAMLRAALVVPVAVLADRTRLGDGRMLVRDIPFAMKAFAHALIMVIVATTSMAQHSRPQDMKPQDVILELTDYRPRRDGLNEERLKRRTQLHAHIAENPQRYIPAIREILRAGELEGDEPETIDRRARIPMLFGRQGVVYHLGREHADPILLETFVVSRRHFEQTLRDHAEADRVYRARRAEDEGGAEAELAEVVRLNHVFAVFSGRMTRLIEVAGELRSPVLVDQVLDFYESGLNDRQSGWPRYPLLFAPEREDVIPRLKAIMEGPRTDVMVIHQIKQALEWYARTLAQQEQRDGALAAGEVPPAGAAAVPPDARPR